MKFLNLHHPRYLYQVPVPVAGLFHQAYLPVCRKGGDDQSESNNKLHGNQRANPSVFTGSEKQAVVASRQAADFPAHYPGRDHRKHNNEQYQYRVKIFAVEISR
ncbi:hypothetical protein SDC9_86809 [bioreactor metagenome]|uniref:Uncharacterized protein n=1 Tax=bioreactor metagenome TaxID=1076179 RepID=A0A644ZH89_9ZZZZ